MPWRKFGMSNERYKEAEQKGQITKEEYKLGWHFCIDWDGLLINKNDPDYKGTCLCQTEESRQEN